MEEQGGNFNPNAIQPVPNDPVELGRLPDLLERVPEFREQLYRFETEVFALSEKLCSEGRGLRQSEVESLIFRAFYRPLQNRPFQAPSLDELASLRNGGFGIIPDRNLSCEICGENRSTDRCHILPKRLGGSWDSGNLLILCPTHHRLFDRFMLSQAEYARIDWERKLESAQEYADSVTLKAHKEFWRKVDDGQYRYIGQYHETGSTFSFIKHVAHKLLTLFADNQPLRRNNLYKVIDPELKEIAKVTVKVFVQNSVLREEKKGTVKFLFRNHEGCEVDEHICRRIWQHFS